MCLVSSTGETCTGDTGTSHEGTFINMYKCEFLGRSFPGKLESFVMHSDIITLLSDSFIKRKQQSQHVNRK